MAKKKTYKKTKKTINTSPKNQKIVTKKKKGNKKYKRYISNSNNTIKKHNSVKNNDVNKNVSKPTKNKVKNDIKEKKSKAKQEKVLMGIKALCSVIALCFIIAIHTNYKIKPLKCNLKKIEKNVILFTKEVSNEQKRIKKYGEVNKIPILTFHRISLEENKNTYFKDNEWVQSILMFEKQMNYLYSNNYKTLNLDEFYCWYQGKCQYSTKTVVITFDDGDLSDYYLVLPVLKKYKITATAFIVGSRTKQNEIGKYDDTKRNFITKETIKKSKKEYSNLYYESHTYNLHDSNNKQRIYNLTEREIQMDFDNNKEFHFNYIAYPFGNYNDKLIKVTRDNKYKLGFTFRNYDYATRDSKRYEIPRIKVNGYSNVDTIKTIVEGAYKNE